MIIHKLFQNLRVERPRLQRNDTGLGQPLEDNCEDFSGGASVLLMPRTLATLDERLNTVIVQARSVPHGNRPDFQGAPPRLFTGTQQGRMQQIVKRVSK